MSFVQQSSNSTAPVSDDADDSGCTSFAARSIVPSLAAQLPEDCITQNAEGGVSVSIEQSNAVNAQASVNSSTPIQPFYQDTDQAIEYEIQDVALSGQASNQLNENPPIILVDWWRPRPGLDWQIQLQGAIDMNIQADVYVFDLFQVDAEIIQNLQSRDKKVICYFSAGVYVDWSPDAIDFPKNILGKPVSGWPGERWIDIRQTQDLYGLMENRLDLARELNCDGVLFDDLDAYEMETGFAFTHVDQIMYNSWLADEAHSRQLAAGFQNAVQLIPQMEPLFDFVVAEKCNELQNCDAYILFIEKNKAVFAVEFPLDFSEDLTWAQITEYCKGAIEAGLPGILKSLGRFSDRIPCTP
eukprot:TRINITY_DN7871_c0_g1_i3.p1 TRINITY_DN7871_c0_g1~~TRINITY_DN7871_c0_g1_i3.p1  ORF type:complete len:356 (-),score=38.34 TRINITY_DN7871_c0_g1_i3:513-1580(-)